MGRERRFREKCVTSLLYDPLISDGRSGSRCPRTAHQRTDRCEPIRFRRRSHRRATSHKDVVTWWRYTVGRPAASTVSGIEAPR